MKTFVLDSYALLCLFDRRRQPEKDAVVKYLSDAENGKLKLCMSKINEGEVFYRIYKHLGGAIAVGFREDIKRGLVPLHVVSVSEKRVEEASVIKAKYSVSFADAFCIELARDLCAPVITGDPEFESVKDIVNVLPLA